MTTYQNPQLPPGDRIWIDDREVLYPRDTAVLNTILKNAGVPMALSPESWDYLLDLFHRMYIPFHPQYIPERVILHIAKALEVAAQNQPEGWNTLVALQTADHESFSKAVTRYTNAPEVVHPLYGSHEVFKNLQKQGRERLKALQNRANPQPAASPANPKPSAPEQPTGGGKPAQNPAPAPKAPEPRPQPGQSASTPSSAGGAEADFAQRFPELHKAYKSGILARLVWSSIQKALGSHLNAALGPLAERLTHLEESLHRLEAAQEREEGAREGEKAEPQAASSPLLNSLESRLAALEETAARIQEALEQVAASGLREDGEESSLRDAVAGLALLVKTLAQHVAELQALAFGPTQRPPLIPQEGLRMLEDLAQGATPDPALVARWLRRPLS